MANQEALLQYSESIKRLRKQCFETGMTDEEFRRIYAESLNSLELKKTVPECQNYQRATLKYLFIFFGIILVIYAIYNFKPIYSYLICNIQDYVYPGLTLLRKLSIPLISLFPSLTDFYHESCLIQNPFFTIVDMDCWPCSTVSNVQEINAPEVVNQQFSSPFIYETKQQTISIQLLKNVYIGNKDIFDKESSKILLNNKIYIKPEEMFHKELMKKERNSYIWRFNNINAARLLRQIIPRPKVIPKFGQSTERFLIIDSNRGSFHIPDTECNYSFLLSLSSTRTVQLIPAEECKYQCKVLKVELKQSYLLWYNWWYWRPVIEPSDRNSTFIAHVGSYC